MWGRSVVDCMEYRDRGIYLLSNILQNDHKIKV